MLIFLYIIVSLSHVAFGLFAAEHRFNKIATYIVYSVFGIIFFLASLLPISLYTRFLLIFLINVALYLIMTKGNIIKNIFQIFSYAVIFTIFLGCELALKLINCKGCEILRWTGTIIVFALLQLILYKIVIPKFQSVVEYVRTGWWKFIIGDCVFLALIHMQIIYPFQLRADNLWTVVAFLLSAFAYFFTFDMVFINMKSIVSFERHKQETEELKEIAYNDALTSIPNKASYDEQVKNLTDRYTKENIEELTTIIVIDIDNFKRINDTYGHLEGDKTLQTVALKIKSNFCEENYNCYRIGGDEFVVVALNANEKEIKNKITELSNELNNSININISAGYSVVNYKNIDAIRTAFKNADKFMYKRKYSKQQNSL